MRTAVCNKFTAPNDRCRPGSINGVARSNDSEKAGDNFDFGGTYNIAGRSFVLFASTAEP